MKHDAEKTLHWEQRYHWQKQVVADNVEWAKNRVTDPGKLEAYSAGLEQGFGQAISILRLHGFIKTA
jgi:hypothetical protein